MPAIVSVATSTVLGRWINVFRGYAVAAGRSCDVGRVRQRGLYGERQEAFNVRPAVGDDEFQELPVIFGGRREILRAARGADSAFRTRRQSSAV